MSQTAPTATSRTTVEFPAEASYRSVGRLVLGGVASRFDLPIDRVDDLLLAVESLLLQDTVGDTIRLDAAATPAGLRIELSPFEPGQLADRSLLRVLARLVDEVDEHVEGDRATIELVVSAPHRANGA